MQKNPFIGYLLWFFLGAVGAHRIYLGRPAKAYFISASLFLILLVMSAAHVSSMFLLTTVLVLFGISEIITLGLWIYDCFKIPQWARG